MVSKRKDVKEDVYEKQCLRLTGQRQKDLITVDHLLCASCWYPAGGFWQVLSLIPPQPQKIAVLIHILQIREQRLQEEITCPGPHRQKGAGELQTQCF